MMRKQHFNTSHRAKWSVMYFYFLLWGSILAVNHTTSGAINKSQTIWIISKKMRLWATTIHIHHAFIHSKLLYTPIISSVSLSNTTIESRINHEHRINQEATEIVSPAGLWGSIEVGKCKGKTFRLFKQAFFVLAGIVVLILLILFVWHCDFLLVFHSSHCIFSFLPIISAACTPVKPALFRTRTAVDGRAGSDLRPAAADDLPIQQVQCAVSRGRRTSANG